MPRSGPDAEPTNPLDKLPQVERKFNEGARTKPGLEDVERLCRVWAEVARAILMRRKAAPLSKAKGTGHSDTFGSRILTRSRGTRWKHRNQKFASGASVADST